MGTGWNHFYPFGELKAVVKGRKGENKESHVRFCTPLICLFRGFPFFVSTASIFRHGMVTSFDGTPSRLFTLYTIHHKIRAYTHSHRFTCHHSRLLAPRVRICFTLKRTRAQNGIVRTHPFHPRHRRYQQQQHIIIANENIPIPTRWTIMEARLTGPPRHLKRPRLVNHPPS